MKKTILLIVFFFVLFSSQLYAQAGLLDNTYGNGGKATTAVGTGNSEGWGMAIQDDWSVVVGGFEYNGIDSNFALIRYKPNGTLDSTFGLNGEVITPMGNGSSVIYSVALQPDGKIIAGGTAWNGSKFKFALARYNTNGTLDSTYGTNGKVITSLSNGNDKIRSVGVKYDDWSVVVGGASFGGSNMDFALAKYKTDGTLDSTFGTNGKVTTDISNGTDIIFSLAFESDWSVVVGGFAFNGLKMNFALAKYTANGALDNTFGTGGKVVTSIGDSADLIWSISVDTSSHKIIAGGFSGNGINNDFALARYNGDGSLDNTFGVQGKTVTDMGGNDEAIYAVVRQPDGKIVAAGNSNTGGADNNALTRYNTNGTLDSTFGTNGIVISQLSTGDNEAYAAVIQPDGKIVTSGFATDNNQSYFFAARYLTGLSLGVVDFSVSNNQLLIYPNPVEQNATLKYTLNKEELISINLVDMQGRIVNTLVNNQTQTIGEHKQAILFPDELASGSYLLVISTPNGKMSIQIVK